MQRQETTQKASLARTHAHVHYPLRPPSRLSTCVLEYPPTCSKLPARWNPRTPVGPCLHSAVSAIELCHARRWNRGPPSCAPAQLPPWWVADRYIRLTTYRACRCVEQGHPGRHCQLMSKTWDFCRAHRRCLHKNAPQHLHAIRAASKRLAGKHRAVRGCFAHSSWESTLL